MRILTVYTKSSASRDRSWYFEVPDIYPKQGSLLDLILSYGNDVHLVKDPSLRSFDLRVR